MAEQYKLNGKEYEDSFGLNVYEMDLRQYDPAIGRWTVMDPVVHHDFSPYSAFDNNPAYWSDPSGADSRSVTIGGLFNDSGSGMTIYEFVDGKLVGENHIPQEALLSSFYGMETSPGADGGGGDGNGKEKNKSNKNDNQKTEQKIIESVKLLKATDLALALNQNSYFASKITGNVFYMYGVPVIEIGGNLYRLNYSQELNNGYTKTEFAYDTTGTITGFVIGAKIGGVKGVIAGVLIGSLFDNAKELYIKRNIEKKSPYHGFMDRYNNFYNSMIFNWTKYN